MKFLLLILKNVRRNAVRSILTAVGTMVLVFVVTLVWSILDFLDKVTAEKSDNLKAIVTERWQIPSQMPFAYADSLGDGAARHPNDIHPLDSMSWQFYGGTIDPAKRTIENILFAFAMEPDKVGTMLDELELKDLPPDKADNLRQSIARLKEKRNGIILGARNSPRFINAWAIASPSPDSTTRTSTWSSRSWASFPTAAMTKVPS